MNQYIQYHKQPYSKFHSIREFNAKFGTDITENEEYEMMFQYVFNNAKKMQGPDEFLQVKFYTQDEFENMADDDKEKKGWTFGGMFKKGLKNIGDAFNKAKKGVSDALRKKKKETKAALYDAIEMACDLDSDRDMMKAKIDDILEEYDENAEFTAFDVLNDSQEHFEEMGFGDAVKIAAFMAKLPLMQAKLVPLALAAANAVQTGKQKDITAAIAKINAFITSEGKKIGISGALLKKAKAGFGKIMGALEKATGMKLPQEVKDALTKVQPSTMNDLDDLLSGDEEEVEEEYEEELDVEPAVTNIVTEKKKISDLVRKTSSDSAAFSKDMRHLIQFRNSSLPLHDQLMKGRPKYLKAIKSFVKGDKNAEVKMSWRQGTKTVKIADLKPKIESLKALLRSSPGVLRVVQCL